MQKLRTPVSVFFQKGDARIPTDKLKIFVAKNLEAAKKMKGTDDKTREQRQYVLSLACRFELELIRRGEIGDPNYTPTNLTPEQTWDLMEFFIANGGDPKTTLLPNEEDEVPPPPGGFPVDERIYEYECGCRYNLTKRIWDKNCPLFADGRCPQAEPRQIAKRSCNCIWPGHCGKCEEEYIRWWKNQVAADLLLGRRKNSDFLFNEEGRLNSDEGVDLDLHAKAEEEKDAALFDAQLREFESEGGSLALSEALTESDRRVLARATQETGSTDSPLSGLFIGSAIIIALVLLHGAYVGGLSGGEVSSIPAGAAQADSSGHTQTTHNLP